MFIHDTHLPQLLTPWHYTAPKQHAREVERLFLPGWHLVGTLSDLPRDGDFLTLDLLGYPLIVWRTGGECRTFLNVCPHRFSRIAGRACGHAGERLQCQYHGWEFDGTGNTRKIPDARSFKPMAQGELGLRPFRTRTCGQLIFATFDDEAPELEDFLGPGYAVGQALCGTDRRLACTLDYELAANWKCKVENSLESYHVDMVHPATFKRTPDAEECFHEFGAGWTTYATLQQPQSRRERVLDRIVHRLARREPDPEYKHYHYYPHVMFGKMRLFTWVECTVPLGPDRTRVVGRFFCYGGRSQSLKSRILTKLLSAWQTRFFETLRDEDCGVLVEVQRGLSAARQPSQGLISIREERCWHFQSYIQEATGPKASTNGAAGRPPLECGAPAPLSIAAEPLSLGAVGKTNEGNGRTSDECGKELKMEN